MFMQSKVMYQGQRSSEVKLWDRLKCENGLIWKVEVQFEPNWGDLDQMLTCIIHKVGRQVTLVNFFFFFCMTWYPCIELVVWIAIWLLHSSSLLAFQHAQIIHLVTSREGVLQSTHPLLLAILQKLEAGIKWVVSGYLIFCQNKQWFLLGVCVCVMVVWDLCVSIWASPIGALKKHARLIFNINSLYMTESTIMGTETCQRAKSKSCSSKQISLFWPNGLPSSFNAKEYITSNIKFFFYSTFLVISTNEIYMKPVHFLVDQNMQICWGIWLIM